MGITIHSVEPLCEKCGEFHNGDCKIIIKTDKDLEAPIGFVKGVQGKRLFQERIDKYREMQGNGIIAPQLEMKNGCFKFEDCFYFHSDRGVRTVRCPKCRDHGEDIDCRGDCKNLIIKEDGEIIQCMCYSQEHK